MSANDALLRAVQEGDLIGVKVALNSGASPNAAKLPPPPPPRRVRLWRRFRHAFERTRGQYIIDRSEIQELFSHPVLYPIPAICMANPMNMSEEAAVAIIEQLLD